MKKIIYLLTNRFTLYITVSAIVFLALILNIDKYKADIISTEVSTENYSCCFKDLDNEGNSEKMQYFTEHNNVLSLTISTEGKLIGQWNFSGNWATTTSYFFADYDNDDIKEIFVFTVHNDSIFLHCLDAINKKVKIENKAVCKVYKERGVYDFKIHPCTAFDVNADGFKEIFFSISTGFSTRPRNMFAYYPGKDSILISPESYSLVLFPQIFDLDGDNTPEFMNKYSLASGNCQLDKKYTDQYSWLMVFTPEMEFKFPPVRFNAHPAISQFVPYNPGKKKYILVFHYYEGTENFSSFMALFDIKGKLIRKKNIEKDIRLYYSLFFSRDDEYKDIFVLQNEGALV
jgi:hypothetical protein